MKLAEIIQSFPLILTECAVSERLRRAEGISLHPQLFNTPLIYDNFSRQRMTEIYYQYRKVAVEAKLPQILCAPTWRLDQQRLAENGFDGSLVDDAVDYMLGLRRKWRDKDSPLFIGGLVGPQNDCYSPSQAPSEHSARIFHRWQIDKLAAKNVDCVIAQTIPAASEACGIAKTAAEAGVPAIISFVINREGRILDDSPLMEAINYIDSKAAPAPIGYMVNCIYPTFLKAENQPAELFTRLIGIQANSSSKDHTELEGSEILYQDDLEHWGRSMLELNRIHGVRILGGCCGTDHTYLRIIANGK